MIYVIFTYTILYVCLYFIIGGVEIKRETVLVGAEVERKELVLLLQKRALLTSSTHSSTLYNSDPSTLNTINELNTTTTNNNHNTNNTNSTLLPSASTGFGGQYAVLYGLGDGYKPESELTTENERFQTNIDTTKLPAVLRDKGKNKSGWITGDAIQTDNKVLEKKAIYGNRNKMVYSGLS